MRSARVFLFDDYRYWALAEPEAVFITNHGRDDVVLLGAEDYARLQRYEQKALHVSELPQKVIEELGSAPVSRIKRNATDRSLLVVKRDDDVPTQARQRRKPTRD